MLLCAILMQVEPDPNDWVVAAAKDGSLTLSGKTVEIPALEKRLEERLAEKKYWRDPSGTTVNYRVVLVADPATPFGAVSRAMQAAAQRGGVLKVVLAGNADLKDGELVVFPIDKGLAPTDPPEPVRLSLRAKTGSCAVAIGENEIGRMTTDEAKKGDTLKTAKDAARTAKEDMKKGNGPLVISIDKDVPFQSALQVIHELHAAEIDYFEFAAIP